MEIFLTITWSCSIKPNRLLKKPTPRILNST